LTGGLAGPVKTGTRLKATDMTKQVRIENADISTHKVIVFKEHKNESGEWVRVGPAAELNTPTQMATDYIHSHQRLVVEEAA